SEARKITAQMRDSVRSVLRQVPGYDRLTSDYEKATRFLEEVEPELSTKRKTAKGTTVRKLTYALNQNNEYRQLLIDALDAKTGSELHDHIAGYALNRLAPRGLMRSVAGLGILYKTGNMLHPGAWLNLALTSPRAVGEVATLAGEA